MDRTQLPSPRVAFDPGFLRRIEAFAPRIAAARERREGSGTARLDGSGLEFVGRRPYRPGDDPRRIDWELLAAGDRAWVRILHREAAEHWAIVLDVSGSMGVGEPGKLQSAAEVAVAIAAVGLRLGAEIRVATTATPGQDASDAGVLLRRPADLAQLIPWLESVRAAPEVGGLGDRAARATPPTSGRVFLLGDLLDAQPADLARLARPGRSLVLGRVLADHELDPAVFDLGAVRLRDAEGQGDAVVRIDDATLREYRRALEAELERWDEVARRRGLRHVVWRSDAPFEEAAQEVLF